MRFQPEIWSLLKRNISKGQLLGYAIANLIGLSVILTGILFFADARSSGAEDDSYFSEDYIVLSKRVDNIGFEPVCFSDEEIEDLSRQRWATKIGEFTSSRFAVNASVSLGGRGLSSYMFCESVPDDFFDKIPAGWEFDPAEGFVPIIICKDYLTLYNFGFAIPQGLPQISEDIVGAIPITLRITGEDNHAEYFDAGIVGFSSRLNTIAVPQSFMDWANERFSTNERSNPSRLIVRIDRMAATDMTRYLNDAEIEIAGDKEGANNISEFLSVVSSVVAANGIVISSLALFILILSIFLLLQKSRETLRKLMLLGVSPNETGRYYNTLVLVLNACITLAASAAAIAIRQLWAPHLEGLGLGGASTAPVLLTAALYLTLVTLVNFWVIRRKLLGIWHNR